MVSLITQRLLFSRLLHRSISIVSAFTLSFSARTVFPHVTLLTTSMAFDFSHSTTGFTTTSTRYRQQLLHVHLLTLPPFRQLGCFRLLGPPLGLSLSLCTVSDILFRLSDQTPCTICILAVRIVILFLGFGSFIAGRGGRVTCSTILLLLDMLMY